VHHDTSAPKQQPNNGTYAHHIPRAPAPAASSHQPCRLLTWIAVILAELASPLYPWQLRSYRLPGAAIEGEDEGVRLRESVRRMVSCARDPIQTSPKAPASSTGWKAQ
jgi:hypothetical protein